MKFYIYKLFTVSFLMLFSKNSFSQNDFTLSQKNICNTAKNANYLTQNEKEIILLINLARVYPSDFCSIYVDNLTKHYYDSSYILSLKKELKNLKPIQPIYPDSNLFTTARCWALEAGIQGIKNHQRVNCKYNHRAECIAFYKNKAIDIVIDLLVDWGVPELGHRHAILDSYYNKIGVSIQTHKTSDYIAVIDFL